MSEAVFEVQGAKIALINAPGMYNDLLGLPPDPQTYYPWQSLIQEIKATGANTVTLIVSGGVMAKATDSTFDPTLQSSSPDMAVVRTIAQMVKAAGMDVVINPFFTVANVIVGDPNRSGADRPYPTDKHAWAASFSQVMLHWAQFAQEVGARTLLPFTDETQHLIADPELTGTWLQLIAQVRQVFGGSLTSGWWTPGSGDSITKMPRAILDQLDTLGIGLFPDLSFNINASVAELTAAYHSDAYGNDVIAFLQSLSATYGKKIWITDKAFHSFDGAAAKEGRIFTQDIPLVPDSEEQARLYESFLLAISRESGEWLEGVSFQNFNNIIDGRTGTARFLDGPLSESPQGKPAEAILTSWFQGRNQGIGVSLVNGMYGATLQGGYHHDSLDGGLGNDVLVGGSGDDVLRGGPAATAASVYEVKIQLKGIHAGGLAPIVQVLDGSDVAATQTVSAVLPPNTPPGASATDTVISFFVQSLGSLELQQLNWAILGSSLNDNRLVRVESVTVNGVSVDLSRHLVYTPPKDQHQYPDEVGQLDSYHGGGFVIDISKVAASPRLVTLSDSDTLNGGQGNDTLSGGAGDDALDGGQGLDVALYEGSRSAFDISRGEQAWTVAERSGTGSDTVSAVERLAFADMKVALDLSGSAGQVAKILGAVFGTESIRQKDYVGIGLSLADAGATAEDLMQLALNANLGAGASNERIVSLLYANVVGVSPPAEELAYFKGLLDRAEFTPASLGMLAANTSLNAARVDLAGLAQVGLEYV